MNLPNRITIFRVALIPVVLIVLYLDIPYNIQIAAIIFAVAALTDLIDGYIARSRNLVTDFGKFADPLADKILVISVLIYLVYQQIVPDWMVIIILAREFAVSGLRIVSAAKGVVISASLIAKFKTQSQMIAVIFALLEWPYYWWVMLIAVILTVASGIDYFWKGRHLIKE
jgi:CDP-diacylglycerol--glycerol-3-phosphate 3-phosphatidyltransferase